MYRRYFGAMTVLALLVGFMFSPQYSQQAKNQSFETIAQREEVTSNTTDEILLHSRQFIPQSNLDISFIKQRQKNLANVNPNIHILIQLSHIPTTEEMNFISATGIQLLNYIPHNAWFATSSLHNLELAMNNKSFAKLVRWIGPILPQDKMPKALWQRDIENWALTEDGKIRLNVSIFEDVTLETARRILLNYSAVIEHPNTVSNKLTLRLPVDQIASIANEDIVRWIDVGSHPLVTHNDGVRNATSINTIQGQSYDLLGQGITVGMWDAGAADWTHNDFKRPDDTTRIITRTATILEHATHVAGTLAGDGTMSQSQGGTSHQWKGVAPEVTLVSYDFSNPLNDYAEALEIYDIALSQNSWGWDFSTLPCDHYGDYRGEAPEFDSIVRGDYGHPIPVIFSAGDERGEVHCSSYKPYGNIAPPGGAAKNVITVGAINSDDKSMTTFSSWGPVDDGRIKPEVVAPGCEAGGEQYIHSTLPGNTYGGTGWCGTSMAAPVVSGISALLVEQYRRIYGPTAELLPATIKAVLAHSAQDLGNPGPDYAYGYGLVNAESAADLICTKSISQGTISQGKTIPYMVTVHPGTTQLKVTLAWDDPPAAENAALTLINDLDLLIQSPTNSYRPWTLDPTNPSNNAVKTQQDRVNNLVQVLIPNPAAGEWIIQVTGFSVPQGPQQYSIVSEALSDPISRGLCYLRQSQQSDGSWTVGGVGNVGATSLAALAFLNAGYDEDDPHVAKAIQYILSHRQTDGSICVDCSHVTYETSMALLTLKATRAYTDVISEAANWLLDSQWDENCAWGSVTQDNAHWGGFGYGNNNRPDLSNSQFAFLAMYAIGVHESSPAWDKAEVFVSRCQNYPPTNDGYSNATDGGFIYVPGRSAAGDVTAHGSMTGAGIWGLALTQNPPTEERFSAALNWVEANYAWDYHPLTDGTWGDQSLYYYYLSMAKALSMARRTTVTDPKSIQPRNWYEDLRDKLVSVQKADGSWVNANIVRGEGSPDLVTAYALLSLQTRELAPDEDLILTVILHSPADIHLFDEQGRHVGKAYETGGVDLQIPSSSYTSDEPQTITLAPLSAGNYHLEIIGTGEGDWQLEIIGSQGNIPISYATYSGSIITDTVLSTDLNVGAFVGPLSIFSTPPTESPKMLLFPDNLSLEGALGETLQTAFFISETTDITTPLQRGAILVPDLTNSTGTRLPIVVTPSSFVTVPLSTNQSISISILLDISQAPGTYTGKIVVETVNAGAKFIDINVKVGIQDIYLPMILRN